MPRTNRTLVILTACLAAILATGALLAEAPAPAPQLAPASAESLAPAQAPAAEQCLPDAALLPPPLPLAGNQTCEECQATCDDRQTHCYDHCTGRNCIMKCYGQYLTCVSNCPC